MKFDKKNLLLYAVTDRRWLCGTTLTKQVEQALLGGATLIQLCEKEPDNADFSMKRMKAICAAVSIPVIAIGGIDKHNVMQLSGSGIGGIADISAIFVQKNMVINVLFCIAVSKVRCGIQKDSKR